MVELQCIELYRLAANKWLQLTSQFAPHCLAAEPAENRRGAEGTRVRMVDDLLRRHQLVGMQRAQLKQLLGVPPSTPYLSEYDYVYWLGPERGAFSIDSEWLVVRCQEGVVVSADVVTD